MDKYKGDDDQIDTDSRHNKRSGLSRRISGMSLSSERVRKLSRSDGALNIRNQLIESGTIFEEEEESNEDIKEEARDEIKELPLKYNNSNNNNNNRNKPKRKDGHVKMPDMMSRLLHSNSLLHSNNNKKKRRKESIISRILSNEKDDVDEDDSYTLRYAVRKFDAARVIELVSRGKTDIDGSNQYGVCALHEASIDGNMVCIKILVNHGAKINKADSEGFTPLDYAVFAGNFECAAYLIEKGAKEDNIKDGQIVYTSKRATPRRATFS